MEAKGVTDIFMMEYMEGMAVQALTEDQVKTLSSTAAAVMVATAVAAEAAVEAQYSLVFRTGHIKLLALVAPVARAALAATASKAASLSIINEVII
jgi:succinyl-CoA synthetase alpha subunit